MKLATLCYVKQNNKTLMLHRNKKQNDMHKGKWNGLGGKIEPGETPEECAIREVYEESGLQITQPQLKGFITFPAFDDIDDWYVFLFTAKNFTGQLMAESPEGALAWVDDAQLMDLNLWKGDTIFMPWLENHPLFSAKFIYHNGDYLSHTVVFYK